MKATSPPVHFPDVPGPWGVDTVGKNWCVIHRDTLQKKVIGPVVGFTNRHRPNYFDRAMAEAARRNKELK